jgi:hypothetical protein
MKRAFQVAITMTAFITLVGCGHAAPLAPDIQKVFQDLPEGATIGGGGEPRVSILFHTSPAGSQLELSVDDVHEYSGTSPEGNLYVWNSLKVPNGPHTLHGTIITNGQSVTESRHVTVNNHVTRLYLGSVSMIAGPGYELLSNVVDRRMS